MRAAATMRATTILFLVAAGSHSASGAYAFTSDPFLLARAPQQPPAAMESSLSCSRSACSLSMGVSSGSAKGAGPDRGRSSGVFTPSWLGKNGSFLGIRWESGYLRRSLERCSSVAPLMPDGGLSPCVIKVLGVGGGGSNAVSQRD